MIENLADALARIAELETQVAQLSAKKTTRRKVAQGEPCQFCGDTKNTTGAFLGLPLCADWKPCASRVRRQHNNAAVDAYAYDERYRVDVNADGTWSAWFGTVELFADADRGAVRRFAYNHRNNTARGLVAA